jgi:hypothetical protein
MLSTRRFTVQLASPSNSLHRPARFTIQLALLLITHRFTVQLSFLLSDLGCKSPQVLKFFLFLDAH